MAAYGCMRALSTVLDSVSGMSALFPELEAILFPLMQRLTSTEGQDVFEEVLELISYFTYFSPSVSAPLAFAHPGLRAGSPDFSVLERAWPLRLPIAHSWQCSQ